MKIQELKQFTVNKIATLEGRLANALQSGDTEEYAKVEAELNETKETLKQLEATN